MIYVYGASDDLVEVERNNRIEDEFDCYSEKDVVGTLILESEFDRLDIECRFDGHWKFSPVPVEDTVMPPWEMRVTFGGKMVGALPAYDRDENGGLFYPAETRAPSYSQVWAIDAPTDTTVTFVKS